MELKKPTLNDFELAETYYMDFEWVSEDSINALLKKYGVKVYFTNVEDLVTPVIVPIGFRKPTGNQINRKLMSNFDCVNRPELVKNKKKEEK